MMRRARARWVVIAVAGVLITAVTGATGALRETHQGSVDIAPLAQVTASSTHVGSSARDVVTSGSVSTPGAEWASDNQTLGAWLQLTWPDRHLVNEVTLVRNPLQEPGITTGFLTFEDGSRLSMPLSNSSRATTIAFTPRSVSSVRFTVTGTSSSAVDVAVSEILVSDQPDPRHPLSPVTKANVLRTASRSSSTGDGVLVARPGSWVQYAFSQPEEVASVRLVGGTGASARLAAARLSFSDGSSVPVGAVTGSADQPTIVGFMPRVVTSVKLTVTSVHGSGALDLADWAVYQRGVTPVTALATGATAEAASSAQAPCAGRPESEARLVVLCPTPGTATGSRLSVTAWVPTAGAVVHATAWGADLEPGSPVARAEGRASTDGVVRMGLDVSALPTGPFTVRLASDAPSTDGSHVDLVLYRPSTRQAVPAARSFADRGRTLVFDEEFSQAVSVSRTGQDTFYAASKPTNDGVEDFGDAIFADPDGPDRTIDSIDGSYLRLMARRTTRPDPGGFGRRYVGALLASARKGGSGVSAQYGYFEARMAVSSATGSWPAFWLLPTENLVQPQKVVPEIDAVELYGHEPTGACSATHEREMGEDKGVSHCGPRFEGDRSPSGWHTYAADVAPTGITFFVDGRVVAQAPQVRGGGEPFFFLLDLALGGGWPVDLAPAGGAAVVFVDHVRVFV